MRRSTFFLIAGMLGAALPVAVISVYLLRDVDRDMTGRLNDAFLGLCAESFLFALVIGGGAGLLATVGRVVFHLRGYSPRVASAFYLGIGVTVCQYPWDIAGKKLFPARQDLSLSVYIVAAISVCAVVLLRDAWRQKRTSDAAVSASVSL